MNDTINNLLQEKRRWERRIVELGGANHVCTSVNAYICHRLGGVLTDLCVCDGEIDEANNSV